MRIGAWKSAVVAASGDTSAEVDLGMPCNGMVVLIGDTTGTTWTVLVALSSGGTFYTLDKPEAGGAMALPEQKASYVRLAGVQYIKMKSASSETGGATVYVRGHA